jgi:hypothetical protein
MKRWFVALLVTDADGNTSPKVEQYVRVNYRIWTKDGFGWCFGQLATDNVSQFDGDNDIFVLPDASLDNAFSTIPTSVRNAMLNTLQAAGFETSDIKTTWTIRQVLQYLKGQLQTDNDVESGDVREP